MFIGKANNLEVFVEYCKNKFFKHYSSYIDAFSQKNVDVDVKFRRISYIKGFITISAEIKLTPKPGFKEKNNAWKVFGVKLITIRKIKSNKYKCVFKHCNSLLFSLFLKKHLRKLSRKAPCKVCKETLGNILLRVLCFSRFQCLPKTYRGKDLSFVYFVLLMVFSAVIIASLSNALWYS